MKYIKLFEQYIRNNKINSKVYHVSIKPVNVYSLGSDPMWFALEKSHSDDGWLKNTASEHGKGFQYEADIKGKIGHIDDPDIMDILHKAGEDINDWIADVVSNPTAKEIMKLNGTKALISSGYDGIVYPDYDPRDFQKDLDALIVFNPKKTVKNFNLIQMI